MITHQTIHGNQITFTLTDEQMKALKHWGFEEQFQIHADGTVSVVLYRDHNIEVYTFRKNGDVILEERDFMSDGWETYNYGARHD